MRIDTSTSRLFLSFWHICLDNLPEGDFAHRRISAEDAKLCIDAAREGGRLMCVSEADLLAPYRKRERRNYEALCRVLQEHFAIDVSLRDSCSEDDDDDGPLYFTNSLNLVQVKGANRLIVVTCCYTLPESGRSAGDLLNLDISPSSVEFHLIESA